MKMFLILFTLFSCLLWKFEAKAQNECEGEHSTSQRIRLKLVDVYSAELDRDPDNSLARKHLAETYLALNDFEKATKHFQKALENKFNDLNEEAMMDCRAKLAYASSQMGRYYNALANINVAINYIEDEEKEKNNLTEEMKTLHYALRDYINAQLSNTRPKKGDEL